jgi:hypothetical protein
MLLQCACRCFSASHMQCVIDVFVLYEVVHYAATV